MVCEYEFDEESKTITVNCMGCVYGSSIADYPMCMLTTIDKLSQNLNAQSVILRRNREYEYDFKQVKKLIEVAKAIKSITKDKDLMTRSRVDFKSCERWLSDDFADLEEIIMEDLRKDPMGAYVKLRRKTRRLKATLPDYPEGENCYRQFIGNVMQPIQKILDDLDIVQSAQGMLSGYDVGDREIYREIFHPTIRPNFMLTKYMSRPPERGEVIDRYTIPGGVEIEVYNVPGKIRYVYHVTPPEFKLDEDNYTILDAARRYMAAHKPRATEFTEPERMREVFSNIGSDMITDLADHMGTKLSKDKTEELTSILTRYTAGLGILEILLADKNVEDVYINSPVGTKPAFIRHAEYGECETNLIPTQEDAEAWATRFRMTSGRPLDEANPVLDTETDVPGGRARVSIITRTLSPEGLGFALRRHRDKPWTYPLYLHPDIKYMNELFAGLMSFIIDGARTFLVAGTRSSGKSSLLGATMLEIMRKYRIVSVEDTLELPIRHMRDLGFNVERMKSRSVITRVETELPAEEAIRTALRLGDSSLIIGEVRSTEAQALYEAMRVGALANTVAGTIHGDSPYGVFDRVVNDLGVPPTSFKATDFVVVCNTLKGAGGLETYRRVMGITEVRKHWQEDPSHEGGFVNLMKYDANEDELVPTDTFLNGESKILNDIASNVKEWAGDWGAVWENINLRGKVKKAIVDYSLEADERGLLEAPFVVKANNKFHIIMSQLRDEVGSIPADRAYNMYEKWLKDQVKTGKWKEYTV
ncbi:MAG: ATPase, T2SS/T4P/T4SS family [Candidatus Aenigmatarchaeota archaeon]